MAKTLTWRLSTPQGATHELLEDFTPWRRLTLDCLSTAALLAVVGAVACAIALSRRVVQLRVESANFVVAELPK